MLHDHSLSTTRRSFLLGSSALASSGLTGAGQAWAQTCSPGTGFVDAHCHVFNASDLPAANFLKRVILKDYEDTLPLPVRERGLGSNIAALLVRIITRTSKSARTELDEIKAGIASPMASGTGYAGDNIQSLSAILRDLIVPDAGVADRSLSPAEVERLIEIISKETGVQRSAVEDFSDARTQEAISRGLLSSASEAGRMIRWAYKMLRDRRDQLAELVKTYGTDASPGFYTPALVDFSGWLDEDPASPIVDQIQVMDYIQRQSQHAVVHSFAPFDPWRQVVNEIDGVTPSALDLVKAAVEDHGFVGVKLYPPMGFLPANNATSDLEYPARALAIDSFKARIDQALKALYSWAEADQVAIMAHATDSNGAAADFAVRSNPAHWGSVISRFPGLHLNLGHFGDFESPRPIDVSPEIWEHRIGEYRKTGAAVFADMSYLYELLPDAVSNLERRRIVRDIGNYVRTYDPKTEGLLYGSDWIMIEKERKSALYRDIFETTLTEELALDSQAVGNIMRNNALRFLHLTNGSKAYLRLRSYYRRNGLDNDKLACIVLPSA